VDRPCQGCASGITGHDRLKELTDGDRAPELDRHLGGSNNTLGNDRRESRAYE